MKIGGYFIERITAFEKLLDAVIIDETSPEIYCRKYLGHLLHHRKYYLAIYADVLEKLISHSEKTASEISLIDFGAGNGLLGIFSKYCGFKNVFINDIDKKFVDASRKLAKQVNVPIDDYIPGDIHAVQSFFKNELPDAIVGTDVIEHIYSLEDFFSTIKKINPSMVSVFTTASNPKNYFKIRQRIGLNQGIRVAPVCQHQYIALFFQWIRCLRMARNRRLKITLKFCRKPFTR